MIQKNYIHHYMCRTSPLRYASAFLSRFPVERRTGEPMNGLRHLLSFPKRITQVLSQRNTRRTSAPFQVGTNPESLSARSQGGIRFFRHPAPAHPRARLATRCPLISGRCTGFPCSAQVPCGQVRPRLLRRRHDICDGGVMSPHAWPHTFWFRHFSTFGLFS